MNIYLFACEHPSNLLLFLKGKYMGTRNLINQSNLKVVEVDFGVDRSKRILEPFLLGPISMDWLSKAACLPGRALHLAIVSAYIGRMLSKTVIQLQPSQLRAFGLNRNAWYRALDSLVQADLIQIVHRQRGKAATISIAKAIPAGGDWGRREVGTWNQ